MTVTFIKLGLAEWHISVTVSQLLNILMTTFDLNTVKELMAHRRSIKPVDMDSTKEVSKDILLDLVECGNWAPSHGLTEPLGKNVMLSHSIMAIVMERGTNPKIPVIEEVQAVACAVQNMHLAASAIGLGLYWSSPVVSYGDNFKQFLKLGEEDQCLGFLFVGWPKEGFEWPTSRRKPAAEKLLWCD